MTSHNASSQKDLYRKINSLIPSEAWESTVGIIIVRGRSLYQFGTGTLLRIADQSFIVTAAHVIKEAHRYDNSLCITEPTGSFIQVSGNWICSAKGQYGTSEDLFDIAVLQLDQTVVEKLTEKSFLRLYDVSFIEDLSSGVFCLFGYPTVWSQPSTNADTKLSLKPFQYATYAFDGSTDTLPEYQERFHLLLSAKLSGITDINGKPMNFRNREGFPVEFPRDLCGISGCSVWKICDTNRNPEEWDKERPKIVALQTGVYHQPQIIKGTRWVAITTLLHEAFPELRPAMSLWMFG